MCRKRALLATVLAPLVLTAGVALAAERAPSAPVAAVAPTASGVATAAQRAEARRLDPLARAAFWASQAEADGRDLEAGVALSQALRAMGRHAEAVEAVGRALIAHPDAPNALLEMARAQIERGQGFYAIEPARRAAALNPLDWRPQSLLGVAYEQAKRDDEALSAHQHAVALAPSEAAPRANLAMHLAGKGDLAGAEALLRVAVAQPSATLQIRQNLALVVGLQGRLDEAEKLARQDLPPETVDNNLAWLRAATGQGSMTRSYDAMRAGG